MVESLASAKRFLGIQLKLLRAKLDQEVNDPKATDDRGFSVNGWLKSCPAWMRNWKIGSVGFVLLCLTMSVGAIWAFPIWDDGWLWLLIRDQGVDAIRPAFADRPLNGLLWQLLGPSETVFWYSSWIAQAIAWPAIGFITARLWSKLFPELQRYGCVAACVAVAPFAITVQLVTANVALASLFPVILAYAGLLLLMRHVSNDDRAGKSTAIVGLMLFFVAVLIQEYALPVALAAVPILVDYASRESKSAKRARYTSIAILFVAAAGYVAYTLTSGDLHARSNVGLPHVLNIISSPRWVVFQTLAAAWRGTFGEFALSFSNAIDITSFAKFGAACFGLLVAALLVLGSSSFGPSRDDRPDQNQTVRSLGFLCVALACALLPVIIMGRPAWEYQDGMSVRFGIPALPIVGLLVVRGTLLITRRRYWVCAVGLIGFVAGSTAVTDVSSAINERTLLNSIGEAVLPFVEAEPDHTVVAVSLPRRNLGPRRQWELVARMAANWSPELRQRFWAFRYGDPSLLSYRDEASQVFGPRTETHPVTEFESGVGMRNVSRSGHVGRVLYVEVKGGQIVIEPYYYHIDEASTAEPVT